MIEQIKLLENLQQIDAKIEEHEKVAAAVPARLKEMRENLGLVESLLAGERARLAEAERYHSEQERGLRLEEDQIHKAKLKLQQVRNTKEYIATTRELETLRKMSGEREEEVLKIMEAVEKVRASIRQHDGELTELRQQVAEEERRARETLDQMERAMAETRKEREATAQRVKPDVIKRYKQIRLKRGLAVVPVRGGTCQGCNMSIPPQLYNMIQRGDQLHTCPNCHRLIYFEAAIAG